MISYTPFVNYTPPVGRVAIRGKMRAEIDSIRYQIVAVLHGMGIKNRETDVVESRADGDMYALQQKTIAETGLLKQKTATELAQTSNTIPLGTAANTSTAVEGIVEKQKNLFQKQTDGYDRDAEQKLAKIMVDTWTIRQTTDGELSADAGVANSEISKVLVKAKSGIGVV